MKAKKQTFFTALKLLTVALAFAALMIGPAKVKADGSGRGLTAPFEIAFLKSSIDHHFAALRMTELAAGTDQIRNAEISPNEGTSPSPNFSPTPAKSSLDEVKSLARRNNRAQREEILMAQRLLRQWYGIEYQPHLTELSQARIRVLEEAPAGHQFDHLFLEIFSRHHFVITVRAVECLTSSELTHDDLKRMCRSILEAQLVDIDEMRHLLCREFNICDYQPFSGFKGHHTGDEREPGNTNNRFKTITDDEDEDGEQHYVHR